MAKTKISESQSDKAKTFLGRLDDGTIQITITIPLQVVQKIRELVVKRMVEELTLPGFRKGKAPTDIAIKQIDQQKIYELTLQNLLPEYYSKAVTQLNLNPILAPKFELVSVEEDRDWEVRAITCEIPSINLGDYKKNIKDAASVNSIWVPGKTDSQKTETSKSISKEEREQQVIESLLKSSEIKIPRLLIDEEVNHKLSQLLDQIQKLGLTIEQYLSSTGKKVEDLKTEYASLAANSIKLVLLLNKIAEDEKITVEEKEIDEVVKAGENALNREANNNSYQEEYVLEQKRLVRSVLLRRKALEYINSLV